MCDIDSGAAGRRDARAFYSGWERHAEPGRDGTDRGKRSRRSSRCSSIESSGRAGHSRATKVEAGGRTASSRRELTERRKGTHTSTHTHTLTGRQQRLNRVTLLLTNDSSSSRPSSSSSSPFARSHNRACLWVVCVRCVSWLSRTAAGELQPLLGRNMSRSSFVELGAGTSDDVIPATEQKPKRNRMQQRSPADGDGLLLAS